MDSSIESVYKILLEAIPVLKPKTIYTRFHLAIVEHYVTFLQSMSEEEFPKIFISDAAHITIVSESFAQELKKYVFTVPTLKKLPQGQHGTNKYRAVKEFTSFLVRFLYHKPAGSIIYSCADQIISLEKELRFLLTVLGDTSLMVCADEHEEFKNLFAEFEDVANEAGSFVHFLFFIRTDRAFGEIDDRIGVVLNHINHLKANVIKLSDVAPCMSRSTYMPHQTSVVDSLLVLDLFVRDLEDLMNRDDINPIADVKDQIQTLQQGLICLQRFIKDTGSTQDQLKEFYMQIGVLAHQAQHLIVSFLAGDAPPWYIIKRLICVNRKIELCRSDLLDFTMKYKSGGLKVAEYFNKQPLSSSSKRNTEVDDDIVGFEENKTYIGVLSPAPKNKLIP